jgi:sodium transport system ATP-binding protein
VQAVADVSFDAPDGAVTGLLGPNGAGKSTTLRMVTGVVRPDAGQVWLDGVDVAADPLAARRSMGVLPDALGLYPRLTAEENIAYFGRLQGLSGAALTARIDALCALLDLTPVRHRRVGGFSQGERMKVALGRALVHDPRTVLLDEPTNGLDVMSTRAVRALIRRLRDDGRCVVFSSHLMAEVAALCDTVVVVARGTVVAAGAPEALRAQAGAATFEEAFVALTGPAPEPA